MCRSWRATRWAWSCGHLAPDGNGLGPGNLGNQVGLAFNLKQEDRVEGYRDGQRTCNLSASERKGPNTYRARKKDPDPNSTRVTQF